MRGFSRIWPYGLFVVGLAIALGPLCLGTALPVAAQADSIVWTEPVNLSNTLQGSKDPAIVTDAYGYVHVFWSEDLGGRALQPQDPLPPSNSILYRRWDGETWTTPTDILSVPGDPIADFVSVAVDSDNYLHAVWTGQANLYYSYAPAQQAYSARAWSKPVIVGDNSARSSWMVGIAAGPAGDLHMVYATSGSNGGVYYLHSAGIGAEWEAPIKLSGPMDPLEESISNLRITTDTAGRIHVAWQTNQVEGFGQAVYYAHSPDDGKHWSSPLQIGYRMPGDFDVGLSSLFVRGQSEVYLIYDAGTGSVGRYQRVSQDGGATWSAPFPILTEMEGLNGFLAPLVDGAGQIHLIVDMRTRDTQVVGIYYARWLDPGWTRVSSLATAYPYGPSAHYTAAAVRLGNELHVVWTQARGGGIWYLRGILPRVIQVPALPAPTPGALAVPSPTAVGVLLPTSTPVASLIAQPLDAAAPATDSGSQLLVLYSIGVPFVLVLAMTIGTLIYLRLR